MKKLLLIGGGGHCASVADAALATGAYEAIGIVDIKPEPALFGEVPFVGTDDDLPRLFAEGYQYAFITLGSVGDSSKRERLYQLVLDIGFSVPNIIDPTATVSSHSALGTGIFVGKKAVVNAGTMIKDCAIINTAAVVEHDCQIGSFAHISPSATLCGNVTVGFGTHIGAGATIQQGITVGEHAIIGMGSVVVHDIPDGVVAFGNPCREVRKV